MTFTDVFRVVAKVVEATPEQETFVSAESEILEYEVRIADGQVLVIDFLDDVVCEWLGCHDETVNREHDPAQLGIEVVIRVAGQDDGIRGHRTLFRDYLGFATLADICDR